MNTAKKEAPLDDVGIRETLYRVFDRVLLSTAGVWVVRRTWCSDDERWHFTKSAPGAGDPKETARRRASALTLKEDVALLFPDAVFHGNVGVFPREWPVQSFAEIAFHFTRTT